MVRMHVDQAGQRDQSIGLDLAMAARRGTGVGDGRDPLAVRRDIDDAGAVLEYGLRSADDDVVRHAGIFSTRAGPLTR